MIDLIRNLFSAETFIPHGHCYLWKPGLVWLHVTSDTLVALAYYSIPLTLFYFVSKRKDLPFNWIFLLFASFITACGTTHILEVWTLWHPIYWLSGSIKGVTAAVSVGTAIALLSLVPQALALPSPTQLRLANQTLEHEIGERQQVEAALRQSEAKNRAMLAAIPDLLLRVKRDGTCLDCIPPKSPKAGKFIPISNHLSEKLPPDLLQYQLQRIEQALTTGELQVWEQQLLKDSVLCDEEVRLVPCNDDEVLIVVRDISEAKREEAIRKRAEKELELQAVIVKNMADGVCLVRPADGAIVYTNPKFDQMFGYETGELQGQHVSVVNYADFDEAIANRIMNNIRTAGEATYEAYNVKKDGTPFWCQATATVFNHPDFGTVLVAVQHDITLTKQSEVARHKAEQQRLEASLKEKEVLLKEIHHRVKNNLQIIYSLLRLQRRTLKDSQAAEILLDSQSRIETIALIHEKLYGTGNLATVDFSEYIPGLLANLLSSYHTQSKQIMLETEIDAISLSIDKAIPCGLIINELISNSLKYAFPEKREGQIQVTFHADEQVNVILTVRDDGIGLPKGFDLAQADSLGLQLVQDFVDQLKGIIEVNCSAGTEFRIKFCGDHKT